MNTSNDLAYVRMAAWARRAWKFNQAKPENTGIVKFLKNLIPQKVKHEDLTNIRYHIIIEMLNTDVKLQNRVEDYLLCSRRQYLKP